MATSSDLGRLRHQACSTIATCAGGPQARLTQLPLKPGSRRVMCDAGWPQTGPPGRRRGEAGQTVGHERRDVVENGKIVEYVTASMKPAITPCETPVPRR